MAVLEFIALYSVAVVIAAWMFVRVTPPEGINAQQALTESRET